MFKERGPLCVDGVIHWCESCPVSEYVCSEDSQPSDQVFGHDNKLMLHTFSLKAYFLGSLCSTVLLIYNSY